MIIKIEIQELIWALIFSKHIRINNDKEQDEGQEVQNMNKETELERIGTMIGYRKKEINRIETHIEHNKFITMKLWKEIKDLEIKYNEVKNKCMDI